MWHCCVWGMVHMVAYKVGESPWHSTRWIPRFGSHAHYGRASRSVEFSRGAYNICGEGREGICDQKITLQAFQKDKDKGSD